MVVYGLSMLTLFLQNALSSSTCPKVWLKLQFKLGGHEGLK